MNEHKFTGEQATLPKCALRPSLYYKVLSSYKSVLILHDITILLLALATTLFIVGRSPQHHNLDLLALLSTASIFLFIFIFSMANLYSYGANFIWSDHFENNLKALGWVLVSFGIFVFLIYWEHLYDDRILIPLLTGIMALLLFFSTSGGLLVTHLAYALAICLLIVGAIGMVLSGDLSVIKTHIYILPAFYILSASMLVLGRYLLVHNVFNGWKRRIFRWKMIIIGSDEEAKNITNYLIENNAPFYVKGFLASGSSGDLDCILSKSCLGNVNALPYIATTIEINDIVITDEGIGKDALLRILDYCIEQRLNVWFPPKLLPIIDIKIQPDYLCGLPMVRLCAQKRALLFNRIKHGLDALIALPLLIVLLPVYTIIALAIKLNSEGPVFYKADAIGRHGVPFKLYKFRSMFIDSDYELHKEYVTKLIKGKIGQKGTDGQTLKITDDPRVTAVGRVLRKYSLDELPQLINVLKGEMSLVGPRPCLPYEYEQYKEWYKKRTSIRPGITGVWQVTGRSEVAFEDMILLDLYYIYNRSVLLDFQILIETVRVVLMQKGAY